MLSQLFGAIFTGFLALGSLFGVHASAPVLATPSVPTTTSEVFNGAIDAVRTPHSSSSPANSPTYADSSWTLTGVQKGTEVKSAAPQQKTAVDLSALPLGDGKVSTAPKAGYVFSCQQNFQGGGAQHDGDWITGKTWNANAKLHVEGNNTWAQATFSNVIAGALRILTGNGLPVGEPTGNFPIAASDPAYQIDRNPNAITAQSDAFRLAANPSFAASPTCVPMGAIGVALDGVAIYNALDAAGRDAVAHEVQDSCDGHPDQSGEYHYHGPSACMPQVKAADTAIGYALDGFPISSLYAKDGHAYTNKDLDACHGTTSPIMIDGTEKTVYHYVLTYEYPYTIGCFMGTPVETNRAGAASQNTPLQQQGGAGMPQGSKPQPPQEAITACAGLQSGASCSLNTPQGTKAGSCRTTPDGTFACIPQ